MYLARLGKKILVIESDPQASLAMAFGYNTGELGDTFLELLNKYLDKSNVVLRNFIILTDGGVYLLPIDIRLTTI